MEKHIDAANIEKISWINDTLRIYYKNGQVVAYKNVPEGIAVGMAQAPSAGSYMTLYIAGKYSYEVEKQSEIKEDNKNLERYKNATVGLYATDRPNLIPAVLQKYFFRLIYDETLSAKVAVLSESRERFNAWVRDNGKEGEGYIWVTDMQDTIGKVFSRVEKTFDWQRMKDADDVEKSAMMRCKFRNY